MKTGTTVNMGDLAAIFGVSRPTVSQWVKRGCPFVTKADRATGREWEFDSAASNCTGDRHKYRAGARRAVLKNLFARSIRM